MSEMKSLTLNGKKYTSFKDRTARDQITSLKASGVQQIPLFANSIEECTDTTKMYVLPDGFIYAYKATVVESENYTNLVPTSTDTDGSIYNGVGYKDDTRLSSSGGVSSTAQAGSVTTGFIPYTPTDVIRMKGAEWLNATTNYQGHYYLNFYKSDKSFIEGMNSQNYESDFVNQVTATYDEATGITTFVLKDGSDMHSRLASAAYFRINAYGSGADLIVTVNEEIVESGSTTVYAWMNTGHAFIPADYEEQITTLQQLVDGILDGSIQVSGVAKFDPTVYRLPVLDLTGDISPVRVSKDNKVTMDYIYGDRSGTCTLKGQGATSYKIAQALGDKGKYNYTITFDVAFEAKEGWGAQKKYCLKANWIDPTHSRNICSCKQWGMMVKSRSAVPEELADLPNGGAIDGFPIIIMLNGAFHGLYTFNIPKDGWMFGLVEDVTKTQALVGANDHTTATQFKGEVAGDESDFELEFVSDADNATWVNESLNTMIRSLVNSDGTDLDTTVAQYIDWDSAIDYLIDIVVVKAPDCVDKNFLLVTFDGVKWYISAYDRDSIWCLNWDASGLSRPVSNVTFAECATTSRLFELIVRFKSAELKERYWQARSNALSESRIMQTVENFAWAIPAPVLMADIELYPSILGTVVNTVDQIGRAVRQRLAATDEWVEAL